MAMMEYVLLMLLAAFAVNACNGTSIHNTLEDDVMTRLAALEKNHRESQTEIQALRDTVADQKNTIDKQATKLRTLEQDIITLKVSQHRQSNRFQRSERLLQSLLKAGRPNTSEAGPGDKDKPTGSEEIPPYRHDKVKDTEHGVGRMKQLQKESVNVKTRQASEGVAFSVYLDHDVNVGAHQVLKYNKILTNEGSGYNTHTGVFTCTMDGMYLFSFFIGERDARQDNAALIVNSRNMVDAVVDGAHATQDTQSGNVVAVRLHQGDSVWVESTITSHVEGSTSLRLTTFTGALLYY